MGNEKKPSGNLSLPTIPDFKEPEIDDGNTRVDRVPGNTEVTVVMGYGPTIPSFNVPGLPDNVRIADSNPPSVDDMIADSLHAAVIPQPPTLSFILQAPAYAPTDNSLAPLGSLADHMPPSVHDPADAIPEQAGAGAVQGGRSRAPLILVILAVLVALGVGIAFWRHLL